MVAMNIAGQGKRWDGTHQEEHQHEEGVWRVKDAHPPQQQQRCSACTNAKYHPAVSSLSPPALWHVSSPVSASAQEMNEASSLQALTGSSEALDGELARWAAEGGFTR